MNGRKEKDVPPATAGEKRRKAMIDAAYALFTEKGYAAVSVDEIILRSKGSKSSLYKFFGNKEGILKAVTETLADEMVREIRFEFPSGRPIREALYRIGMILVDLALSDNAINQHRHAVAHAREFPGVSKLWYESGPRRSFDGITEFLEKEAAAGRLRISNPRRAALLFAGMIIFHENMRLLVCLPRSRRSALTAMVSEAVDVFLAAYGA